LLVWSVLLIVLVFVLYYYVSLRSEFHVVRLSCLTPLLYYRKFLKK
jgi:hypothetical protein